MVDCLLRQILSFMLFYAVFPMILGLVAGILVLKFCGNIRRKFFTRIYHYASPSFFDFFKEQKKQLFSTLAETKSADEKLRAQGVIRVLEVGAGPGMNFEFYPSNVQLIVLEPNTFFEDTRNENLKLNNPMIKIVKTVIGFGENMDEIEDNSMDAVIGTFLHCSVQNNVGVLKEIHRVLAPGGKYYFMEHSCGVRSSIQWRVQNFLNPLWNILFDGCNINRNAPKTIENCGLFINVESKLKTSSLIKSWISFCLCPCGYGTAEKPLIKVNH
ncbi:hypothetical protein CHUAL_008282 [Chamberlinius hualienensis]